MITGLLAQCQADLEYVRAIRRELHRFPETGTDLPRTRALILRELRNLPLLVREDVGGGIVADLRGGRAARIALRADMDALPMQEETGLDFASEIPGHGHMCGHDAHVAMLLGAARLLAARKSRLRGDVRFLFQPNEENHPGGAQAMIEAGCLDRVDEIFGLHLWPGKPVGWIGTRTGALMARPDVFTIILTGKGGHASAPHLCVDPVLAASRLVCELQSIVSRRVSPLEPAVLSVTRFHAGTAYNIIPETVFLQGTVRTLADDVGALVRGEMARLTDAVSSSTGTAASLEYVQGFPVLVNHAGSVQSLVQAVRGAGMEIDSHILPTMAGEDFSYYLQFRPGCFFFLGCGLQGPDGSGGLHNACFNPDEGCFPYGVAALTALALCGGADPDRAC